MDPDTYIGYYVSLFIQTHMGIGFLILFAMFIQLQIGFCSYINTCADDFKQIVNQMDEYIGKKSEQSKYRLHDINIKASVKEAIQLHGQMLK